MRQKRFVLAIMAMLLCFVSPAFAQNVAKIGDAEYATLSAAISAATSGGTVTLIDNVSEDVTISENLTVDGAGKLYTGTMTIKTGLTVTVKNVNFLNAGIVKASGTTGTITVSDCTFDGADKTYGYAVTTSGAGKLTIENCTVKDYGYGFLYNSKSLATHSVKNVTVENCNYGVRMASCNITNLVGFVTKDVKWPVQIQANAARTVNMTDCSITEVKEGGASFSYWGGTSNVTFNFKGTNVFDAALPTDANFIYKDANGNKIEDFENNENVEIVKPSVAKVGETGYPTLAEAIAAAASGATITLVADIKEDVTLSKSVTIEGAGKNYTGKMAVNDNITVKVQYLNFVNAGVVKDTKSTKGNYTFYDCTFDGKGEYAYPLSIRGANKINVENCEVKDYAYGFLYVRSSVLTLSIKNVVAENFGNYGVYFTSGITYTPVIEELTIKNSPVGVLYNNSSARTLAFKNCRMEGVTTAVNHTGGAKTISCTFQGVNDFGGAAFSQYVNFKNAAMAGTRIYPSLSKAVEEAQNGETVKPLSNIVLEESLTIPADKNITLDLNGKTVSQTVACTGNYNMILNKGNLTIKNGTISFKDTGAGDPNFTWGSYTVRNEGTLVVEETATIEHLGEQNPGNGQANVHMYCAIFQYSGSTTINGGTISTPTYRSARLWKGEMTINGGTFDGQLWVQAVDNSAKLTINGGTFAPRGNDGSSVYVENSSYTVDFAVTGGTFNGKIGCADAAKLAGCVKGGKFTEAAKNGTNATLIAEGYVFGELVDGYYSLVYNPAFGKAAQIGDVYYDTFAEAYAAAQAGETLIMHADLTMGEILVINKAITLDGNGKTLTSTADRAINVSGADGVTIKNLTINASGERAINVIQGATNVTIDNVTATAANYTVNLAASAANAVVAIKNSNLTGLNVVNVGAPGAQVTVDETVLNCADHNEDEKYAALALNKDAKNGSIVATNVTFNIEGDSRKATNQAENGTVTIDGSTEGVEMHVAYISYGNNWYGFATLQAAIDKAVETNGTVKLIADIELTESVTVPADSITLDLNGKTIAGTDNNTSGNFYLINNNKGNLTIVDGSEAQSGKITLNAEVERNWSSSSVVVANNLGTVTVKGGTIEHLGGTSMAYGIDNLTNGANTVATLNIEGGKVASTYFAVRQFANNGTNNLNITGGNIGFAWMQSPNANVNVAKISVTGGEVAGICFTGNNADVTLNAKVECVGEVYGKMPAGVALTTVNGCYTFAPAVASVADVLYASIQEAVDAAQNGETVQLIADVELTDEDAHGVPGVNGNTMVYVDDKEITLDMNEKTIAVTYSLGKYLTGVICVDDGAGLTITGNGTIDVPQADRKVAYLFYKRGTTGYLVVENGTFHAGNLEDSMFYTNGDRIVTVKGGTFILDAVGERGNGCPWIFNAQGQNIKAINVYGGTYNDDIANQHYKYEVNVPDTHDCVDNGNGTWTVIKVVAKIGETSYASLAEAVAAAQDGNIVTLAVDAEGEGIVIDKSITIDFNEKTYSFNGGAVGSSGTESNGFQILAGGTTTPPISAVNSVVLKNGTLNVAEEAADKFYILVQNYANLTVEDMNLDGTNLDKYAFTDGDSYVLSNNCGEVVVKGETNITANNDGDKAFAFDACVYQNYVAPVVKVYTTGFINGNIENSATIELYSGTYSFDVTEYCATRHAVVDNHDGTYDVEALDVEEMTIVHEEYYNYEVQNEKSVKKLTYTRELYDAEQGNWITLFVPFKVPVKTLMDNDFEVAYINSVRSYDFNGDALVDSMYVEYIYIKTEDAVLHANTPYMIRSKSASNVRLELNNATLYRTAESERNNITMSTAFAELAFIGVYEDPTGADLKVKHDADVIYKAWAGWKNNDGNYAGMYFYPFDACLIFKAKPGSPYGFDEQGLKSVGGGVVGEEINGTTYIYDVVIENGVEVTYDLQGRRVDNTVNGIYIMDGRKVLVK